MSIAHSQGNDYVVASTRSGVIDAPTCLKPSEELEGDNESVDSFEKNRLMRSEICKDNIIERRLRSQVVMSILRSYDNEETYIDPIWFNEAWNHENSEERCNWRESIRDKSTLWN